VGSVRAHRRRGGARPAALALTAFTLACAGPPPPIGVGPLPPGVTAYANEVRYAVDGTSVEGIAASLRGRAPVTPEGRFVGHHRWQLEWRGDFARSAGMCGFRRLQVHVRGTTTVPEWRRPPGADSALVGSWDRFLAALRAHEAGHWRIALAGGGEMRDRLAALRRPRCEDLEVEARLEGERIVAATDARQSRYDDETDHGHRDGAAWPPPEP